MHGHTHNKTHINNDPKHNLTRKLL